MNIGIFGATGFIGTHLFNQLGQIHNVRGFSSSLQDESRGIIKGDYSSQKDITLFVKNLDVAIYATGLVDPRALEENDEIVMKSVQELEMCMDAFFSSKPDGQFIFFSSAGALYANSPILTYDESFPVQPLGFYGTLKLKQEQLIERRFHSKNVIILRVSNVFGDPFKKNKMTGVIDKLISSSFSGEVVSIFENLKSERDYLYINDLVSAVLKLLAIDLIRNNKEVCVYNLSSHEIIELSRIINKVQDIFPHGKTKVCFTKIDGISNCLKINSNKFRKVTGWSPVFDFEKALIELKKNIEEQQASRRYV